MEEPHNKMECEKNPTLETEILSRDDLVNHIYRGQSLPQDTRFLKIERGGVFKYFDLLTFST